MKKLTLDVDALSVTSFPTAPSAGARGTVRAHEGTPLCEEVSTECVVTGGVNSCWCSEYHTCDCTSPA